MYNEHGNLEVNYRLIWKKDEVEEAAQDVLGRELDDTELQDLHDDIVSYL